MTTETHTKSPATAPVPSPGPAHRKRRVPQGHKRLLTRRDRITLGLMAGVPTILHVALVWLTALASIALAFTTWDGIGFDSIKWVGLDNFRELFTTNPQFWPAVQHNVIWFVVLILLPTPFGLFLAVQLDKKIR
ncbi:carbohydrate ABC transporter permease, partial [Streptomyces sp. NPDC051913]|uniref:carbohydrate ABC transporter permease n=1 Tax=Streptomyces sp. NPDC051913 TaxID=3365676 RepID=UPI0037D1FD1D